jgi:hypothetical protein
VSKTKSTLIDKDLKAKVKEFEKKQKELKKTEKGLATDVVITLKDIIQGSSHIEAMRWHQYTPGFNDGDPCEFTISDLEIKFSEEYTNQEKGPCEDEEEDSEGWIDCYAIEGFFKARVDVINHKEVALLEQQYEALATLHGTLTSMEGELQSRFGDNMEITVTKKGIETEDYDCGY